MHQMPAYVAAVAARFHLQPDEPMLFMTDGHNWWWSLEFDPTKNEFELRQFYRRDPSEEYKVTEFYHQSTDEAALVAFLATYFDEHAK